MASSTEVWLIPGKDILGDGIVIEVPGFIVDVLKPRTHQFIPLSSLEKKSIAVEANVVMMCGCTISDGGIWDANQMEVRGIVKRNGQHFGEIELQLSSPNLFTGNLAVNQTGNYEIMVYAYQAESGNTGVDKINYIVTD